MNVSPESFSNWILSLGEDGVAVLLVWLAATHLLLTLARTARASAIRVHPHLSCSQPSP